eukprot:gene26461-34638_t
MGERLHARDFRQMFRRQHGVFLPASVGEDEVARRQMGDGPAGHDVPGFDGRAIGRALHRIMLARAAPDQLRTDWVVISGQSQLAMSATAVDGGLNILADGRRLRLEDIQYRLAWSPLDVFQAKSSSGDQA